jgi:hypothetical protein
MMKTIYWEVNGEVRRLEEEEYRRYLKHISSESDGKCMYTGYQNVNEFGGFSIEICAKVENDGLIIYIIRDWVPTPGYSWSETKILEVRSDG